MVPKGAIGYYRLGEIAAARAERNEALDLVNSSLESNALNIWAVNLMAPVRR